MTCPAATTIAARVDGELTENAARRVDDHLRQCGHCGALAVRLRRALAVLPQAVNGSEDAAFVAEVARGLGLRGPPRRVPVLAVALMAISVSGLAMLVVVPRIAPKGQGTFASRGGSSNVAPTLASRAGFTAYLHPASTTDTRHPVTSGEHVSAGDGFSFDVHNQTGRPLSVLLFAVDSAGELHWFYPAWQSARDRPVSITVPPSPAVFALSDGVTPEHLPAGDLVLVGVFSDEPQSAADAEHLVQEGGLTKLEQSLVGAAVQRHPLVVEKEQQ